MNMSAKPLDLLGGQGPGLVNVLSLLSELVQNESDLTLIHTRVWRVKAVLITHKHMHDTSCCPRRNAVTFIRSTVINTLPLHRCLCPWHPNYWRPARARTMSASQRHMILFSASTSHVHGGGSSTMLHEGPLVLSQPLRQPHSS